MFLGHFPPYSYCTFSASRRAACWCTTGDWKVSAKWFLARTLGLRNLLIWKIIPRFFPPGQREVEMFKAEETDWKIEIHTILTYASLTEKWQKGKKLSCGAGLFQTGCTEHTKSVSRGRERNYETILWKRWIETHFTSIPYPLLVASCGPTFHPRCSCSKAEMFQTFFPTHTVMTKNIAASNF